MKPHSNTKDFIKKAITVHGSLYNYDKAKYQKATLKVVIHCTKCGNDFYQQPSNHLSGQGCSYCKGTQKTIKNLQTATNHLPYTFDFSTYVNGKSKIPIYCSKHDSTEYRTVTHILKRKTYCSSCETECRISNRKLKGMELFLSKAKKIHGCKYDYSEVVYEKMTTPVKITCNTCKFLFTQIPHNHLRGTGCPACGKNSQGWSANRYKNKPTVLYVLYLSDTIYKIGITSRDVLTRYKGESTPYTIIFEVTFNNGEDAWKTEKQLLQNFRQYAYKGPKVLKNTGTRELITKNPLTYLQEVLNAKKELLCI